MHRLSTIGFTTLWLAASGCALAPPATANQAAAVSAATPGDARPAGRLEELARKIAGDHLSVAPDQLVVVRLEAIEWRDSGLGCPQPGFDYQPAITPGHLAVVRDARGVTHRVHMTNGRGFVCEQRKEQSAKAPVPLPTFSDSQLAALARADLASRLQVPAAEVSVLRTRAVEWPGTALRCDATGNPSSSKPSKGFVITLAHRGREYTYHSDSRQVMPCPPIERR